MSAVATLVNARAGIILTKDSPVEGAIFNKILDLVGGFYFDSAFTSDKLGLGISKEITTNFNAGIYALTRYETLFKFKPEIIPGIGISYRF